MNYYKRHLGDYSKDTKTLTVYQHGVYTIVLDYYYSEEGPVSDADVEALCRPKNAQERAQVDRVMRRYFKRDGDLWRHSYADRVIEAARAKADRNREVGALGGRPPKFSGVPRETEPCGLSNCNPEETQTVYKPEPTKNPSHKPLATSHKPQANNQKKEEEKEVAPDKPGAPTTPVWFGYATAYEARYGVPPVRNAKVNGQLKTLLARLGAADAPEVAAFYVGHPSAYYVTRGHSVDCLLADCEKLRTEWATGRQINAQTARQQERTAANPFARMAVVMQQKEALTDGE